MNAYEIEVIDVRNGNVIETVRTPKPNPQVRYVLSPATGNYIVTLVNGRNRGQCIAVLPGFFRAVTGIHERSVLGSLTLSHDDVLRLGFVVNG